MTMATTNTANTSTIGTATAQDSVRARAEALFVSPLQPSDRPGTRQVRAAIAASLRAYRGAAGCAARMAAEYGEYPEQAASRMRWALSLAAA
jgi:hypothetical protein